MPRTQALSRTETLLKRLKKAGADETLTALADLLFSGAQPQDLAALGPEDMEWLARRAHAFVEKRRPGRTRVEIVDPDVPSPALAQASLIQTLNDDMPFLMDSLLGHLAEEGLEVRLLLHPLLHVRRDETGRLTAIGPRAGGAQETRAESLICVLVERLDKARRERLAQEIGDIHREVRAAVLDWRVMLRRLEDVTGDYQASPPPLPVDELAEVLAFMQWLAADSFVFLGMREYRMENGRLTPLPKGYGVLRGRPAGTAFGAPVCVPRPGSGPVLITKSTLTSRVHRRAPMDLIIIRLFDDAGEMTGELHLLGLFASAAYVQAARDIPLVRRKIAQVMARSGLEAGGHLAKALLNILETFPRDELFELDVETLQRVAGGILRLEERPRTSVFVWRGCSARFASAFAFIPRDRFDSEVRRRIGEILETALGARVVSFVTSFPEGVMVRVHFRLELLAPGGLPEDLDMERLEAQVAEVVRSWEERMLEEVRAAWGPERAAEIARLYRGAFSQGYREAFTPRASLRDLEIIEGLDGGRAVAVSFMRAPGDADNVVRMKLYHFDEAVPLSVRVPILDHAGFSAIEERTFTLRRGPHDAAREIFIHEVVLAAPGMARIDLEKLREKLEESFLAVWNGHAGNDHFNALTLIAGLDWRQVAVLRAIARWLHQASAPYSGAYIAATLRRHPALAAGLVKIFETLFRPGRAKPETRRRKARALRRKILEALADVQSLDEDRIIRMYLTTLMAMRRTNFWQERAPETPPAPLAFKLASREVNFLPAPRPWAEIFVHAPDLEGVHLRGGPIARGGIRWSDRPQDFRTEILGLVKAQNVKNAVIVPVGAKGGFVVRRPPERGGREAVAEAGRRAYRRFISALLDLTDNIVDGRIVPPERVVRLDGDDPYLVVAADKGTATFSDMANEISRARGFWLDDAFASGGSAGYDHKKMGITARGAWEAVKRHFREMNTDIQTTPFTVIGVGDMSGDVFGNGMLLSKKIRLIAAFDHRDIFIDPDPDPAVAYKERKRLFRMERSSWQDYRRAAISAGGGVFPRRAKSIPLSPQIRELLDIEAESLTPAELIRAILRAQADLLWLGGIGTYVRASAERNSDVGDTANDAVRITAAELRVKVVGEGANLGLTQKARIEFARRGGRINTDAIDNSAGVNASDMEVNLKIAFGAAEKAGKLSRGERNRLLADMEPDVAALVLRNNYLQTLCLSVSEAAGESETGHMIRLMHFLEKREVLDRRLEALPTDAELAERRRAGGTLTRPELAVLMSHAKLVLKDDLLQCGVVDEKAFGAELMAYFPPLMQGRFPEEIGAHRLRREIIANRLSNAMINEGGPAFVSRLMEETGRETAGIAAAWALASAAFRLPEISAAVNRLDGRIGGERQLAFHLVIRRSLLRAAAWFLRYEKLPEALRDGAREYGDALRRLEERLREVSTPQTRRRLRQTREEYLRQGAPDELAKRLSRLPYLLRGLDIITISRRSGAPLEAAAEVYFLSEQELRIAPVMAAARRLAPSGHYERMARERMIERLAAAHRELATAMAEMAEGAQGVRAWRETHGRDVARILTVLAEITAGRDFDLPRLALAASLFDELAAAARRE